MVVGRQPTTATQTTSPSSCSTTRPVNNHDTDPVQNMKTTFKNLVVPGPKKSVQDNIRLFQRMSEGGGCRFGSGMCAEHNVKLCRSIETKRFGCVDENGKTTWQRREVAILACPVSAQSNEQVVEHTRLSVDLVGANKKLRISSRDEMDQPRN